MASNFFKSFADSNNYDRLLKGFSEVIHLRESTTFANQLRRIHNEQANPSPSKLKDTDMLNFIEKHKVDIKQLLKDNLTRITEFEPNFSLVSKLTAEQNVERVIEKLKNHQIIQLGQLVRPNRTVNNVYLPPKLRM